MPPYNTCPVCGEENVDVLAHFVLAGDDHDHDRADAVGMICYPGP